MSDKPTSNTPTTEQHPKTTNMGFPTVYISGLMELSEWLKKRKQQPTPPTLHR